jgi:glutamine cyclotransferase
MRRALVLGVIGLLVVVFLGVRLEEKTPARERTVDEAQPTPLPFAGYTIVATYPHDSEAFTQGLDFFRGELFESTGLNGASTFRKVDLETGAVLLRTELHDEFFGEGLTILEGRAYQLTWQSEVAFVYKSRTFKQTGQRSYEGEGWGLTHNGKRLVMSNGTDVIRFRSPATFEVKREIRVIEDGQPVAHLNELEWIDKEIFANVWPTDDVVRIDPKSGEVVGRLNLTALREMEEADSDRTNVTNGIAYLKAGERLFVTGKYWAHIYEIELVEP